MFFQVTIAFEVHSKSTEIEHSINFLFDLESTLSGKIKEIIIREDFFMTYKIHEFSKMTGLTPYTLRFYEKEGLITVNRDQNNIRIYDDRNKEWIDFFLHLKKTGMTIEDLKQYLTWWYEGDSTNQNRLDLLQKQKELALKEMEQIQQGIEVLDYKIEVYKKRVADQKK